MKTFVFGRLMAPKSLLAASLLAALTVVPLSAFAQGNSPNTPAAEHSKGKGGQGGAPVPEPATWAVMLTLAAAGGAIAVRALRQRRETRS